MTRPPARPVTCRGHVWQLTGLADAKDGRHTQYECVLCERVLWVAPGREAPVVHLAGRRLLSVLSGHVSDDQEPVQP